MVGYPNGHSSRVKRHLWLGKTQPEVLSGAVITLPAKPGSSAGDGEIFTRVFQIATSSTSLVLAWSAINH